MIGVGIRSVLAAAATSVDSRVHPKKLPQNTSYPALTYEIVSDPRGHTHDGPDGRVEARVRVTAWSPSYADVAEATGEVKDALDGYLGAMGDVRVWSVRHTGGRDLYDSEVHVHHRPVDYLIQYTED